ncbi:MAG: DUF58 domain-containing protein [bacterium]
MSLISIKRIRHYFRQLGLRGREASLPWLIDRKRIYILPTLSGIAYAVIVGIITIGGLNYSNNNVLAIAFISAAAGMYSAWRAYYNLRGIQFNSIHADAVFCGEQAEFILNCIQTEPRNSYFLEFDHALSAIKIIQPRQSSTVKLLYETSQRGWFVPGIIKPFSVYPHGLFKPWTTCLLPARCMVYPQLEDPVVLWPEDSIVKHAPDADREYTGIREYSPGDSISQIAWKSSARTGQLHVKQWQYEGATELVFDWNSTNSLPYEKRISRLAGWVYQAHNIDARWALHIPGIQISENTGTDHYIQCMTALALMPEQS